MTKNKYEKAQMEGFWAGCWMCFSTSLFVLIGMIIGKLFL